MILTRPGFGARRQQFVSGRQHGDARPSDDSAGKGGSPPPRGKAHRRRELCPPGEPSHPAGNRARRRGCCGRAVPLGWQRINAVGEHRHVFLDRYRVGAGRHDAAGKDTRRLARSDDAVERMAGCDFADHGQVGRRVLEIGCAHSIPVHGGNRDPAVASLNAMRSSASTRPCASSRGTYLGGQMVRRRPTAAPALLRPESGRRSRRASRPRAGFAT
jgi:hypothetical protein